MTTIFGRHVIILTGVMGMVDFTGCTPACPLLRPLATIYSANMAASSLPTASGSSIWLPGHGLDRNSHLTLCQTLSQHRTSFIPVNAIDPADPSQTTRDVSGNFRNIFPSPTIGLVKSRLCSLFSPSIFFRRPGCR